MAEALDDAWSGRRPLEEALAAYQSRRDELVKPTYDLTVKMASGQPVTPPEFLQFGLAMMRMMPA